MRVMEQLIVDEGLEDELEQRLDDAGAPNFWLGMDDEMDEGSDKEDPERALQEERGARMQMLQAVQGALECQTMRRDLERARMQLEDERARMQEERTREDKR
jgi:hypothetical protein